MLLNADQNAAFRVAEKIRTAIEVQVIPYKEHTIQITSSFGVYTLKNENITYEELIHQADINLYKAKAAGRNKTIC